MNENYENEVMVDEFEESGEKRDLSTAVGVGLIAGAGVIAYEGGKRIVKFVAPKVRNGWRKLRGKDDPVEDVEAESANKAPASEK